jgi:hypothetical protein|tara:strand:- start:1186 stop:1362 length:177 start_codon:yes stop_codon:yes gene_type:complete
MQKIVSLRAYLVISAFGWFSTAARKELSTYRIEKKVARSESPFQPLGEVAFKEEKGAA